MRSPGNLSDRDLAEAPAAAPRLAALLPQLGQRLKSVLSRHFVASFMTFLIIRGSFWLNEAFMECTQACS